MISQTQSMKQASTFADGQLLSISTYVDLTQALCELILSNHAEFGMFLSAVFGYFILFRIRHPKRNTLTKEQPNCAALASMSWKLPTEQQEAVVPSQLVKSMRAQKKDPRIIADELRVCIQEYPDGCSMAEINDMLDPLGEQRDSELMEAILSMLPSVGLQRDQQTCEIFLKMYASLGQVSEMMELVADMHASQTPLTARAIFFVMKGSLQANDFDTTLKYLRKLKASWQVHRSPEPFVPQSTMSLLIELAWKEQRLGQLVLELTGMPLPEKTVDAMLAKCVESHDAHLAKSVEILVRAHRETLPDSTYCLLIESLAQRPSRARAIVEEVLAREGGDFSPDLALCLLKVCKGPADAIVVDRLYQKMKLKQASILGAFIWFYIGIEQFEKACDIFVLDMQPILSAGNYVLDSSLHESMIDVAVLCGRTQLAEQLLLKQTNHSGVIKHAKQMFETGMSAVARWQAMTAYWAVLVF
jgi:hypothetical protein